VPWLDCASETDPSEPQAAVIGGDELSDDTDEDSGGEDAARHRRHRGRAGRAHGAAARHAVRPVVAASRAAHPAAPNPHQGAKLSSKRRVGEVNDTVLIVNSHPVVIDRWGRADSAEHCLLPHCLEIGSNALGSLPACPRPNPGGQTRGVGLGHWTRSLS
jgi:hypothetical protein